MMRAWIPASVFFLVLALRLMEPVQDGDLFWHMSYGRQMMEHGTLVPDHTIYSWTPADGGMIYCAWLAELALLGVWNLLGLAGIVVLRYVIVLAVMALWFDLARRSGVKRGPLFWLVTLIGLVSSYVGTLPKPEFFSLLFFNGLVWILFRAKLAAREGRNPASWLGALPPLLLVWVNTHGAFIIAAPLLLAFIVGELVHARRGTAGRLPPKMLLVCAALCLVATACTPYGLAYPKHLIAENLLRTMDRPDAAWNSAYQTIFSRIAWIIPYPLLMLAMVVIFGVAAWQSQRRNRKAPDWSVLLAFTFYLPLFIIYLRTTFFLPAVFVAGAFYLWPESPEPLGNAPISRGGRWRKMAVTAVFYFLAAQTVHQILLRPLSGSWCGFGVGGVNPVEEAEFLARRQPSSPRLVNLFNTGGYLLWRLWPQYQVMVDSRSFPYLGWFNDQFRFGTGEDFDAFLAKYPAPVAVIDLDRSKVWQGFLFSKEWEPTFYGRAAIVFHRIGSGGEEHLQRPPDSSLRGIRNAGVALNLFTFARLIADFRVAWLLEEQLDRPLLRWQLDNLTRRRVRAYHQGHDALRAGEFDRANDLFREALNGAPASDLDKVILSLLDARGKAMEQPAPSAEQRRTIEDGLRQLAAPLQP